jgi:maltose/moltooligosaccharide transporter
MPFPYRKTFVLGFGFLGISIIWPLFNNFVPIFLAELGLAAWLVGFIMTWDNYLNLFVQPLVGERSDRTRTRLGRRKPWIVVGAPLAALFFVAVPALRSPVGIMFAILLTNLSMALFRSPTAALLGDLFPSRQRSTASGIINLMGGLGAIVAFVGGGILYAAGRILPFAFGALVMLAAITLVVLFVREPEAPHPAEPEPGRAGFFSNMRQVLGSGGHSGLLALFSILFAFMGFNALETWLSSFGRFALDIDPGRMSLITSVFALFFVIFALPGGLVGSRFGRRPTMLAGMVALAVLMALGWFVQDQVMLIALFVCTGMVWPLFAVNALPLVYDIGGEARIGAFTGLYYLASNLAAVVGPQTVGILIDLSGSYRVMFLFSALFMALAGICLLLAHRAGTNDP